MGRYKIIPKERTLAYRRPDLAKEWDYEKNGKLTPETISSGIHKHFYWVCENNHRWEADISHRMKGFNCPYCSGQRVFKDNCLATVNPRLASEWHPTKNGKLTPNDVSCGSNKMAWWLCSICGNIWNARIDSRKTSDCRKCAKIIKDWKNSDGNSLLHKHSELVKEWHPTKNGTLTPYDVVNRSGKRVWWLCLRCGREWQAHVSNRSKGHGCECYRNVVLKEGTVCDSMVEALFYLRFKENKVKFIYHGLYGEGMGRHKYDFYIPRDNIYIEVTSFHKGSYQYKKYLKTIRKKKRYVVQQLKANFKLIEYIPTKKDYQYIKAHFKLLNNKEKV